jgi:hypothetical protein
MMRVEEITTKRSDEMKAVEPLVIGYKVTPKLAVYSGARKTRTIESGIHT